jgi:hypothetical protein
MQMVVLGDSVAWGQGLSTANKFSTLVYSSLAEHGPEDEDITVLAHSGAKIGASPSVASASSSAHAPIRKLQRGGVGDIGEVPLSAPIIMDQCSHFPGDPLSADIVLVSGGINDIGAFYIVNPLTDPDDLRKKICQYCYQDMEKLLGSVADIFSNAKTRIVVTGYFPILSEYSFPNPWRDSRQVNNFFIALGAPPDFSLQVYRGSNPGQPRGQGPVEWISNNCRIFFANSTAALGQAVAEVNAQLGSARLVFAKAPFSPMNSALAPQSWLWGIKEDFSVSPEDEVVDVRETECNNY